MSNFCNPVAHTRVCWQSDDALSGTIPAELAAASSLEFLVLSNNHRLSGTVSHQMLFLRNLESLLLHGNRLSGSLPARSQRRLESTLTNYSSATLQTLSLAHNYFTGSTDHLEAQTNLTTLLLSSMLPLVPNLSVICFV